MENKLLISIAIPTYNRAEILEKLLYRLVLQLENFQGLVEICISNNGSLDNTAQMVANFVKKYPDLIRYRQNNTNLGFDSNIIDVVKMARGEFIWLLGDDDLIVDGGIKKVLDFIGNYADKNTGLIILRSGTLLGNTYLSAIEKNKPSRYEISVVDLMGTSSNNSFISILLINNNFANKILSEELEAINLAKGNYYIQSFLYQVMFLKYPNLKALQFNEVIIEETPHYRKSYIEDEFRVFYAGRRKLNNVLLKNKYLTDVCKKAITNEQVRLKWITARQMAIMKVFGNFNYNSFFGSLRLFFKEAPLFDAYILIKLFIIFHFCPSFMMRGLYKIFLRVKYKKLWKEVWLHNVIIFDKSKDSQRMAY
mgnify:FL=1